jgi:hypothetical protein
MDPHAFILDWLIAAVDDPERFPRDSEEAMKEFGLNENQRAVLKHRDPSLIRQWITYELDHAAYTVGHMHLVICVTHGSPPPPPPPRT